VLAAFLFLGISALKPPTPPKPPLVQSNQAQEKTAHPQKEEYTFPVLVKLFDGSVFEGELVLTHKEVHVEHLRQKQQFSLDIPIAQIRILVFSKWKKFSDKKEKNKFYFYPVGYRLDNKQGQTLHVISPLPIFNQFTIQTKHGKTQLYAYYVDYLQEGRWRNSKNKKDQMPAPNPRCVKEIYFLK
jgi:hypothetical protein